MLFKIFNVPTIDKIYKKYAVLQIFKEKLLNNLQLNISARYQNDIKILKFNTKHSQNSFLYLGITYFNKLPLYLKILKNIHEFKLKLKNYLKLL